MYYKVGTGFNWKRSFYKSGKDKKTIEALLAERNFKRGKVARSIRTRSIDTWRYIDSHHIVIDGIGKNNNYLIQFRNSCRNTRGAEALIYRTRSGELTKFDSIGISSSLSHHSLTPSYHCSINDIYHLEVHVADSKAKTVTEPVESSVKEKAADLNNT